MASGVVGGTEELVRIPLASISFIHRLSFYRILRVGLGFLLVAIHTTTSLVLYNLLTLIRFVRPEHEAAAQGGRCCCWCGSPGALAMSHIESRLPNLAVGLQQDWRDLLAWIRRRHGVVPP